MFSPFWRGATGASGSSFLGGGGGSVELAPRLHAADAIVDLVSSGDTLRQNGLVEVQTLLESQAVLIARRDLTPEQRKLTDELRLLIDSVLAARPKRYVMLNARDEAVLPDDATP